MPELFDSGVYRPFWEIGIGTALLLVVLFIHGAGMFTIQRAFNRLWPHVEMQRHQFVRKVFMGAVVLSLMTIHFVEILLWAGTLYGLQAFADLRTAFYFAGGAYTTYGSSEVNLPERWRLLGFIIATSGLFTFGWTTGILVSIVTKFFQATRGPDFHPTPGRPDSTA
jgi:hypothetical protein